MPLQKQAVVYPGEVQEIVKTLDAKEIIRRLKNLVEALRCIEQEPDEASKYKPLAEHLVSDFLLKNSNREIKIYVACCISEVLRIFAPDAPYDSDHDLLRSVIIFLIKQLTGLATPSDPLFEQCFLLLENLAIVKTLNIVLELEASQEILAVILKLMFAILNEGQIEDEKIHGLIVDILAHILNDADSLSVRVLDELLINLVEPHKYFTNIISVGEQYGSVLNENIFEIFWKIYQFLPEVIVELLNRIERTIKQSSVEIRMKTLRSLAKLFLDKNSDECDQCPPLWTLFLSWFKDKSAVVRLQCVQVSVNIFINQQKLSNDIQAALTNVSNDPDASVRAQTIDIILKSLRKYSSNNLGQKRNLIVPNGEPSETQNESLDASAKVKKKRKIIVGKNGSVVDESPKIGDKFLKNPKLETSLVDESLNKK